MSQYIYAFMVFATIFVGWSSWAGLPMLFNSIGVGTMPPIMTATFGDKSGKDFERKLWEAEHTAQSDKNPKLDKIRLEALQAGTAYAMSPCDKTMKSNLIEAVTAYTRAWQNKMDCPRPLDMLVFFLLTSPCALPRAFGADSCACSPPPRTVCGASA